MAWYDPRTWFTPAPKQEIVAPQKSTEIGKQPPVPPMTITLPSGKQITPTPVPTQTPSQFTPKAGGTAPTPSYSGGGGSTYQPISQAPQPVSSIDTFREPADTPFKPIQKSIQEKSTTKSTKDLSIPESRVDVFSPFITKTRKEVGAEEGFLDKLRNKDFDNLFVTTKDISKDPYPKLPYQTRGTEVTGQPDLTFGDIKTGREIIAGTYGRPAEFTFQDIGFGLQKGGQEELSGYEKSVFEEMQPKAQKEVDIAFGEIQSKVTSGEWSLEKGQKSLERRQSELERYFGTKAGEKITLKQTEMFSQGRIETEFKEKAGTQSYLIGLAKGSPTEIKTDWKVPLEIGAYTAGSIIAPTTTLTLLGIQGAAMVTKGTGKAVLGEGLSLKERGIELGKAGLGVAFMYGGLKGATFAVEKSIVKGELEALSRQPVMYNEVLLTREGESVFAVVKGVQTSGGLKTEFNIAGRVLKQGEGFMMPEGIGTSKTSGVLNWDIMGKGKGTIVSAKESFNVGTKGLTFDIVEGKLYGTLGKGILVPLEKTSAILAVPTTEKEMLKASKSFVKQYDKNLVRFDTDEGMIKGLFGGVSAKAEEDLFYARGGKILEAGKESKIQIFGDETMGLYKTPETKDILYFGRKQEDDIIFKSFQNKDLGRIRIIELEGKEPIFDIVGGGGLKGNLPEDTVRLFTGTTKSGAKGALESGLKPSKGFNEVYLVEPKDIEFTKGFAARRAIQSGEGIEILEANIPKSIFEQLKVSRATGKGGMSEITLKNVPKQYLSIYKETPIDTYQGQDLLSVLIKPTKKISSEALGSDIITKGLISDYATAPQSIYYGTGQYERTGGLFGGVVMGGKQLGIGTGVERGMGEGLVLEPKYKESLVSPVFISTGFDLGLESKPLTRFRTDTSFYQPTTQTTGLGLVQGEALGLKQEQLQKLKLQQPIQPITPFTPTPTFDFKSRFGFGGGFNLPKLNIYEGFRGRQSKGRKFGYTPSIVSLGLKGTDYGKFFTATKIPKGFLSITGLQARPIIKPKKRKRR